MDTSVLLPAPFSPNSASTSPCASVSEIASLATKLPKRLVMPVNASAVLTATAADVSRSLRRRLGLAIVDLDRELAVGDRLLGRLDLGHDLGWHLLLEGAQRRELGALVLHHR